MDENTNGNGPISFREAINTFATKADIIDRFNDLKSMLTQSLDVIARSQTDHEARIRAVEAQRLPLWAVSLVLPIVTAFIGWLARGVPH